MSTIEIKHPFLKTKKGQYIKILTPNEYDRLISQIDKNHLKTLFNVCFYTGMRYVEVQRLHRHPEWVLRQEKYIYLDETAQRKVKRITPARSIPIPPQLEGELNYFFTNKTPPTNKVWNNNLKRWAVKAGISPVGIVPKTTRATIESWMYIAGLPVNNICLRQGHDHITSLRHYQALPFSEEVKLEIKRRLAGWN
jgi:integrase